MNPSKHSNLGLKKQSKNFWIMQKLRIQSREAEAAH
jgi:hypothetical protein